MRFHLSLDPNICPSASMLDNERESAYASLKDTMTYTLLASITNEKTVIGASTASTQAH